MRVLVNLPWRTPEAGPSVNQTVEAFGAVFAAACGERPAFEHISRLDFGLSITHPISRVPHKVTVSHQRSTGTFFATAPLNYLSWVGDDWPARVGAVASALAAATAKIHKTRITAAERAALLEALAESRDLVSQRPPPELKPLASVHLFFHPGETSPSVSFAQTGSELMAGARVVELKPTGIAAFLREHPVPPEPAPAPFKRYRGAGNQLEYHQAWVGEGGSVVEHWGVCGDRGEIRRHPAPSTAEQKRILNRLETRARSAGFKSIPISRHAGLLVSRTVDGFGSTADLEERHALEDYLDALTAWLGLGHCDGGSIGSGSMEAFCLVVDFDIALEAITRELGDSPFSAFSASPA